MIDETLRESGISNEGELINNALILFKVVSIYIMKGNKLAVINSEENELIAVLDIEAFRIKI